MAGYVKLSRSILQSTVWQEPLPTRVVWITLLALCDRYGDVEASVPGLAKASGVERGDCERAIASLSAPDPDSRTKEHEGRRIEAIDGGWHLLNYEKYRGYKSDEHALIKSAERSHRYRQRQNAVTAPVTPIVTPVTPSRRDITVNHPKVDRSGSGERDQERECDSDSDARAHVKPVGAEMPEPVPPQPARPIASLRSRPPIAAPGPDDPDPLDHQPDQPPPPDQPAPVSTATGFLREFRVAYAARYGREPSLHQGAHGEVSAFLADQELAMAAGAHAAFLAGIPATFGGYFDDEGKDRFLVKQRHPLALLLRQFEKYRPPPARGLEKAATARRTNYIPTLSDTKLCEFHFDGNFNQASPRPRKSCSECKHVAAGAEKRNGEPTTAGEILTAVMWGE